MSENKAIKHDNEKIRMELLSSIALTEIAKVLTFGAKKYDAHNWRKGLKWSRLLGATLRHVFAFMGGEDKDPETGLSHLAHAGCCIMFLLEHEVTHKDLDDRYKSSDKIVDEFLKENEGLMDDLSTAAPKDPLTCSHSVWVASSLDSIRKCAYCNYQLENIQNFS